MSYAATRSKISGTPDARYAGSPGSRRAWPGGPLSRLRGRRSVEGEPVPDLSEDPYRQSSLNPPSWRGRMHVAMILPAVAGGAWLVTVTPGAGARTVVALYAASIVVMFAVSGTFHLGRWSDREWLQMRRWDHVAIFGLIAASYGAIMGLGVPGWPRRWLLGAVLAVCALGVALRWRTLQPRYRLMTGVFIAIGAVSVVAIRPILEGLGGLGTAVVYIGCGFFGLGALALGLRRPNPWPGRFEYHEVWHLNVIIAVGCQYWVVASVVVPSL